MGNNHNKHFSKKERKILILGIENAGKTALTNCMQGKKFIENYIPTKDMEIIDIKHQIDKQTLKLLVIDHAGGQRQRIFWRHNFLGSQGVVYVIDPLDENIEESLQEFDSLLQEKLMIEIPIAIFLSKSDLYKDEEQQKQIKENVEQQIIKIGNKYNATKIEIFQGSSLSEKNIKEMMAWLLQKTVGV